LINGLFRKATTRAQRTEKEYSFIIYTFFTIPLILLLVWIFILNLGPQSNIAITNNDFILLSIIVVLVLSFRFTELEIPGLKLKRTVEALQKEAEGLRAFLFQIATTSSKATASSSQKMTVEIDATRGTKTEGEPLIEMSENEQTTRKEE